MEQLTVTLENGKEITLGPISAFGALRLEETFGAGCLTDSGSSDMQKSLGYCWMSHLETLESDEEMTFEQFCKGISFPDIKELVNAVAPFLKKHSTPTTSSNSSEEGSAKSS